MADRQTAVFGIYRNSLEASEGADALLRAGFRKSDISALMPENYGNKDIGHEKHTKAPEGAVAGAGAGAIVGGALALLLGTGALAIPGAGLLLAAGPVISALSGVGAGGALGGFAGALIGAGIPEYEVKRYEGRIRNGGILLSVHCDNADWERRAREALRDSGATDIDSSAEVPTGDAPSHSESSVPSH
jgi:hypothetical protein